MSAPTPASGARRRRLGQSDETMVFSIATLVTDPSGYERMLASFVAAGFGGPDCEFIEIDNTGANQLDAYQGLNRALCEALGRYVILCHQDVLLTHDHRATLERRLRELDEIDPTWAVAGNAGGIAPTGSEPPGVVCRGLARLSHRGCDRHGGQMADGPGENRSAMWGHRARLSTQHVSHLTPPFRSRSAGHRLCRAAQPYDPIRFSRPSLPSDSAERDAGAHPCEKGGLAIRISDPHGEDQKLGPFPMRVVSVDENFIVVKRAARIGFSRNLSGFHLYGADLCLNADLAGYACYVIDFHLTHLSGGKKDATFEQAQTAFENKWRWALRPRLIQTTCTRVWVGSGRLEAATRGAAAGALASIARVYRRWRTGKRALANGA